MVSLDKHFTEQADAHGLFSKDSRFELVPPHSGKIICHGVRLSLLALFTDGHKGNRRQRTDDGGQ